MPNLDLQQAFSAALGKVTGWIEGLVAALPNVLAASVVLLVFYGLGRLARRIAARLLARFSPYSDVNRLLAGVVFILVMAGGLLVALGILNLSKTVTSLLAGAGILGLALGFAFQDTAENLIAGVILNVRREFTDGDIVETNEHMGVVESVGMRVMLLRAFDGPLIVIPNSQVFKNVLTNYSARSSRRVDLSVGVSYGDDLERAAAIATAAIEEIHPRDRSHDVELFYEEFGDSSINFMIRFWVPFQRQTDYLRARSEAIIRIKRAFDREGITIPFPIRTVDFSPVGGMELREAWPVAQAGD